MGVVAWGPRAERQWLAGLEVAHGMQWHAACPEVWASQFHVHDILRIYKADDSWLVAALYEARAACVVQPGMSFSNPVCLGIGVGFTNLRAVFA